MECRISELIQTHLPLNGYDDPRAVQSSSFRNWFHRSALALDWLLRETLALSGADFIKMQEKLREADLCGLGALNP